MTLIPKDKKSCTKKFIDQSHLFCEHTKKYQILYTINDQFFLNKAVFKRKITIAWFLDISLGGLNGWMVSVTNIGSEDRQIGLEEKLPNSASVRP